MFGWRGWFARVAMSGGTASVRGTGAECRKFAPNIFNKSKCSSCFKQKEEHSAEALECNRVSFAWWTPSISVLWSSFSLFFLFLFLSLSVVFSLSMRPIFPLPFVLMRLTQHRPGPDFFLFSRSPSNSFLVMAFFSRKKTQREREREILSGFHGRYVRSLYRSWSLDKDVWRRSFAYDVCLFRVYSYSAR